MTPNLLNDDGTASMATVLMLSHHAFRRDIMRLIAAVDQIKAGEATRIRDVRGEWENGYRMALHGHHTAEDTGIFPDIRTKHPDLVAAIDTLTAQHHEIDPVIDAGDSAFADLAHPEKATEVLKKLKGLLDAHLTYEEAQVTPHLRDMKQFPMPADEKAALMYADGFAWSMQGIAPEVLVEVQKMLPEILLTKLPTARDAFEARSKRVWGSYHVGAALTPIPDGYL